MTYPEEKSIEDWDKFSQKIKELGLYEGIDEIIKHINKVMSYILTNRTIVPGSAGEWLSLLYIKQYEYFVSVAKILSDATNEKQIILFRGCLMSSVLQAYFTAQSVIAWFEIDESEIPPVGTKNK